jgi:Flp pilus assembly protein TadD
MVADHDYLGAVESFTRAIQFNPENPTNYVSRALAYKRMGDMEKA